MTAQNKRWLYVILILINIPLGLATRWQQQWFPHLIDTYGGDVLAASCIFFGCRFFLVKKALWKVALAGYAVCVLIEIQQLYQAPWAVKFRNITIVGLFLGHGFLWSDIACYAIGTLIGFVIALFFETIFSKLFTPAAY